MRSAVSGNKKQIPTGSGADFDDRRSRRARRRNAASSTGDRARTLRRIFGK